MSFEKSEEYCEDKRIKYDLSLLTKEIFEKLEYRAAIQGIRLLIDRKQAYDKEIWGNIFPLRRAIVVLIQTVLYFLNTGDTVHMASTGNRIVVTLPKGKSLRYLVLQPEAVIGNRQGLADFCAALDCIRKEDGTVELSERNELIIVLSSN